MRVFKQLDINNSGSLTLKEIKNKFDAAGHPDAKSGKKTANEI
jgi:hypothetical protein